MEPDRTGISVILYGWQGRMKTGPTGLTAFSKWTVSFLMRKWDSGIARVISMYKFGSGSGTLKH
jgi:hypothetical protein